MLEFLASYLRDYIHLVAITPDGPIEGKYFGADAQAAVSWATARNAIGQNIYWTVNLVTPGLNKKPLKADIIGIRCAHVDIDPPKGVVKWDRAAALYDLTTRGKPSVVIDSGNGLQGLWWLNEATTVEAVEDVNRGLEVAFNGDHCWNVDRLLRLPGTVNYPDAKKRAAGRVPTQSGLLVPFTGRAYSVTELSAVFPAPVRAETSTAPLGDGPVPEWTGFTDDAELVQRMIQSKGSIGAQFGVKASAKDLWVGDASNLCQAFPSTNGDVYDRSRADAALMAHLAFWTGKDAARMDRLFRQSALYRPTKYGAREDYRTETIRGAIAACKKVYDQVRTPVHPPESAEPNAPGFGEFLTVGEMMNYFEGCVYVREMHRVMIPGGKMLRPDQFKATYGGKYFTMSSDNSGPSKNAFEAFTECRAYNFPKVDSTCFRPRSTPGMVIGNQVNVYFPEPAVMRQGDAAPFLDLVTRLLPDTNDRAILLAYCASLVQNPGVKFQWAPVLQGTQGNGKTIIASCLEYAVGPRYTHRPAAEDLGNAFNSYLENKLFISVEEVHLQGKRELLDTLKPLITNDRIEVQAKGIDKRMIDNFANWLFCTNHRDAVVKTKDDRRYAIFFTAQQSFEDIVRDGMGGQYFPKFWNWLRADGFAIVADYLMRYDIPAALDPAGELHRAPMTSSTWSAINASMGRAEQEITEAIDAGDRGFRNGWISMYALDALFKEKRIRVSRVKTAEMLEAMGFKSIGRANRPIMSEELKRPILYVKRAAYEPHLGVEEYCFAQGYTGESRAPTAAIVNMGR